ncbi:primosomal protein N' [Deltaproteobacteria bacterium]|nr:primosomal protein N' [Deltaproteobacteria bacterium]
MVVEVAVPLPVFGRFSWVAPRALPVGATVVVPYGSRELVGWVVGPGEVPAGVELKPVREVLSEEPAFTDEQLAFYRWIAGYYLSPLGEVIATATPADTGVSTRRTFRATPEGVERLAVDAPEGARGSVLREVISRSGLTRAALERRLHGEVPDAAVHLAALVQAGLVRGDDSVVEGVRDEVLWIVATGGGEAKSPKGLEVMERLPALAADLPAGVVATLVKRGAVRKEWRPRLAAGRVLPPPTVAPPLNPAQVAAVEGVGAAGVHLLHGVTGAGKTEVYLALAERVVARSEQVLVMVPEISLTPLLMSRFEGRFPGRVAVLHSALAAGEKLREWRRIRSGEAAIVVGARSAVFAPFAALGLVVVDEEHDDSYKQDEGVRYHGRDLAVVRASRMKCPCVLGSATPSLESWRNAEAGKYKLLQLLERATPRPVPSLELVDMRAAAKAAGGRAPLLAPEVKEAIDQALEAGGKAILLYNRRGYATFVECPGCGGSYDCPSCGVALVYHQGINRMDCHYCGFHRSFPGECPQCAVPLALLGRGTERIEEMLVETFAGVPVGRMDADTTRGKGSHARILDDFAAGRTRLLVGTQLVAKGHDFPDVTVAAVLGADHILGMPDFRSAERTWALVTQLCGRAGRGAVAGRVFVQTSHPEHPVFSAIGDMAAFAQGELELRRMLAYPPYSGLVLVRVEAADRQAAREAAANFVKEAKAQARGFAGVDVLGPAAAPLPKLVGRYRFQAVIRGRDRKVFRDFLTAHHASWKAAPGVRRIVDVDPRSMM